MFDELLGVRFEDSIEDIECLPDGEYILVLVIADGCAKRELRNLPTSSNLADPIADGTDPEPA